MLLPLLAATIVKQGAFLLSNNLPITQEQLVTLADLVGNPKAKIVVLAIDDKLVSESETAYRSLLSGKFTDASLETFQALDPKTIEHMEAVVGAAKVVIVIAKQTPSLFNSLDRNRCQKLLRKFIDGGGIWFGVGIGAELIGDPRVDGAESSFGLGIFDGVVATDYYASHRENLLRNTFFHSRTQLGLGLDKGDWMVIRDNMIEKKFGMPHVILREAG